MGLRHILVLDGWFVLLFWLRLVSIITWVDDRLLLWFHRGWRWTWDGVRLWLRDWIHGLRDWYRLWLD